MRCRASTSCPAASPSPASPRAATWRRSTRSPTRRTSIGAGIIGAGPWLCAQGIVTRALNDCTRRRAPAARTIGRWSRRCARARRRDAVDDPSWLAPDRIWIFHGKRGPQDRRRRLGFAAALLSGVRAARADPLRNAGPCRARLPDAHGRAAPATWTNRRGFSPATTTRAGEMLRYLYDGLATPTGNITGELREFGQARYVERDPLASMADDGFPLRAEGLRGGQPCRVHVAFHGCRQGIGDLGRAFARDAGYNRWADANRIVVLYPQADEEHFWPVQPARLLGLVGLLRRRLRRRETARSSRACTACSRRSARVEGDAPLHTGDGHL